MTDEHKTTEPLSQKQVDTLVGIFMSGFISGVTTLVMASHKDCPDTDCAFQSLAAGMAAGLAHNALEDPAFRLDLALDLERRWNDPSYTREMHAFTVHHDGGKG